MRGTLYILTTLFATYILAEIFQAVQAIFELNAFLGYAFSAFVFILVVILFAKYLLTYISLKRISPPAEFKDPKNPTNVELRRHYKFLRSRQIELQKQLQPLQTADFTIAASLPSYSLEIIQEVHTKLNETISPLDKLAQEQIYKATRDVMAGVIFSPFRSLDVLIVLYKNLKMVLAISTVYQSRPGLVTEIKLIRDILGVAMTVNVMAVGDKLIDNILSKIPGAGKMGGDVAQGAGAGFFTNVIGLSAMRRCRNLDPWSVQDQQNNLKSNMGSMAAIITSIMTKELGERVMKLFPDVSGVLDKLSHAVESSFEAGKDTVFSTGRAGSDLIRKAFGSLGRGTTSTFTRVSSLFHSKRDRA